MFVITRTERPDGHARRVVSLNNTCCIKVALPTRMRVIGAQLHDPWNFILQHGVPFAYDVRSITPVKSHLTLIHRLAVSTTDVLAEIINTRVPRDYFPDPEFFRGFFRACERAALCIEPSYANWRISFISVPLSSEWYCGAWRCVSRRQRKRRNRRVKLKPT